jgi:hypothetical protein
MSAANTLALLPAMFAVCIQGRACILRGMEAYQSTPLPQLGIRNAHNNTR